MVIIALGGNSSGSVGSPLQTMRWAMTEMAKYQIYVTESSSFYCTKPIGQVGQADYINAVVRVRTSMSAANVLNNLKLIENTAGRNNKQMRITGIWGPRPLDLDIVDYKGMLRGCAHVCNSDKAKIRNVNSCSCPLILPHPRAHLRPFVVRPLLDVHPFWHHPVTGVSALSMWARMRFDKEGGVLHKVAGPVLFNGLS